MLTWLFAFWVSVLPLYANAANLLDTGQSQTEFAVTDPRQSSQPGLSSIFPATTTQPASTVTRIPQQRQVPVVSPLQVPPTEDYRANSKSDVFGANLFVGTFAHQGPAQFNPDYAIAIGDRIEVHFWGAFTYEGVVIVDPQGNVFLPHVGPVKVLGVHNRELQAVVDKAIRKVFRRNVFVYASLASAQPVRVFVSGFVRRPGLYNGNSMDSLLHYLDQAGGIDPERGSFLNVQVKRGELVRATFDLYEFLLEGRLPLIQLSDGDVIFVGPRQHVVKVSGLAENPKRFEFRQQALPLADLIYLARPLPKATHVRIIRNTGMVRNVEYYPLTEVHEVYLQNGDEIEFTADKKPGTISVRVEGEHLSPQEYVLPYGARLGELIAKIRYSERSDVENIQLFRRSVKNKQKEMLLIALKNLENVVLTARAGTKEEADLRKEEADLILQWVERAKGIEPLGQVYIAGSAERDDLLLEDGDIIKVPTKDNLVLVSGEVLFPNAIVYEPNLTAVDYIKQAGGFTQSADTSRIIIAHLDGSFEEYGTGFLFFGGHGKVRPGDKILVLPKVDVKWRQIAKEIAQIIYQVALAARVAILF